MKMIDMLVEKSLMASKRFTHALTTLRELSHDVEQIARNYHALAQYVRKHEMILGDMKQAHDDMMEEMAESVELDIPSPKKNEKNEDKPN